MAAKKRIVADTLFPYRKVISAREKRPLLFSSSPALNFFTALFDFFSPPPPFLAAPKVWDGAERGKGDLDARWRKKELGNPKNRGTRMGSDAKNEKGRRGSGASHFPRQVTKNSPFLYPPRNSVHVSGVKVVFFFQSRPVTGAS